MLERTFPVFAPWFSQPTTAWLEALLWPPLSPTPTPSSLPSITPLRLVSPSMADLYEPRKNADWSEPNKHPEERQAALQKKLKELEQKAATFDTQRIAAKPYFTRKNDRDSLSIPANRSVLEEKGVWAQSNARDIRMQIENTGPATKRAALIAQSRALPRDSSQHVDIAKQQRQNQFTQLQQDKQREEQTRVLANTFAQSSHIYHRFPGNTIIGTVAPGSLPGTVGARPGNFADTPASQWSTTDQKGTSSWNKRIAKEMPAQSNWSERTAHGTFKRILSEPYKREIVTGDEVKLKPIKITATKNTQLTEAQQQQIDRLRIQIEQAKRASGGQDLLPVILSDPDLNKKLRNNELPLAVMARIASIAQKGSQNGLSLSSIVEQMRTLVSTSGKSSFGGTDQYTMPVRSVYLAEQEKAREKIDARYNKVATGLGIDPKKLKKALPGLSYEQEDFIAKTEAHPNVLLDAGPGTGKTESLVWAVLNAHAQKRINIKNIAFTGATHASTNALRDRFEKLVNPDLNDAKINLVPDWNFKEAKETQFRTSYSMAWQDLHSHHIPVYRNDGTPVMREDGEQKKISAMYKLGKQNWRLLGATDTSGKIEHDADFTPGTLSDINLAAMVSKSDKSQSKYFQDVLAQEGIPNVGGKFSQIMDSINKTKQNQSGAPNTYWDRYEAGRNLFDTGKKTHKDALFYLYEASLHQEDGHGLKEQKSPLFDFSDVPHFWARAAEEGFTPRRSDKKRNYQAIISDEYQDNPNDLNIAYARNMREDGMFLAAGDIAQQVLGSRRADNALKYAFKHTGLIPSFLTGNYRSSSHVVADTNAALQSNVMQKGGAPSGQVAVGENYDAGTFEDMKMVFGNTFKDIHVQALYDWMSRIGLTMGQIKGNVEDGLHPLAGATASAREVPIIFQMGEEREQFQKHMHEELAQHLGAHTDKAMEDILFSPSQSPRFNDPETEHKMHLPMIQQIKGYGVDHVLAMVTPEGAWDQLGFERNYYVMGSRARKSASYYGAAQHLYDNGLDTSPGVHPGTGELIPHSFGPRIPLYAQNWVNNQGMPFEQLPVELQPFLDEQMPEELPELSDTHRSGLNQVIDLFEMFHPFHNTPIDDTTGSVLTTDQGSLEFQPKEGEETHSMTPDGFSVERFSSAANSRAPRGPNVTELNLIQRNLEEVANGTIWPTFASLKGQETYRPGGIELNNLPENIGAIREALAPTIGQVKVPDWTMQPVPEQTFKQYGEEGNVTHKYTVPAGLIKVDGQTPESDHPASSVIPLYDLVPDLEKRKDAYLTADIGEHWQEDSTIARGKKIDAEMAFDDREMFKGFEKYPEDQKILRGQTRHFLSSEYVLTHPDMQKYYEDAYTHPNVVSYIQEHALEQLGTAHPFGNPKKKRQFVENMGNVVRDMMQHPSFQEQKPGEEQKYNYAFRKEVLKKITGVMARGTLSPEMIQSMMDINTDIQANTERIGYWKRNNFYEKFGDTLENHMGEQLEPGKGLTLTRTQLNDMHKTNPREAAILEELLGETEDQYGVMHVQKAFSNINQLPYKIASMLAHANVKEDDRSPKKGSQQIPTLSIAESHRARAVGRVAAQAYNAERIGILDPMASQMVTSKDREGKVQQHNVPLGLTVPLESYQKRLQDMLANRHKAITPTQREKLIAKLVKEQANYQKLDEQRKQLDEQVLPLSSTQRSVFAREKEQLDATLPAKQNVVETLQRKLQLADFLELTSDRKKEFQAELKQLHPGVQQATNRLAFLDKQLARPTEIISSRPETAHEYWNKAQEQINATVVANQEHVKALQQRLQNDPNMSSHERKQLEKHLGKIQSITQKATNNADLIQKKAATLGSGKGKSQQHAGMLPQLQQRMMQSAQNIAELHKALGSPSAMYRDEIEQHKEELARVKALRRDIHDPQNQENWGHALNALMYTVYGQGAWGTVGQEQTHIDHLFSKRGTVKSGAPFTLDTLQQYTSGLQTMAEHMQRTGNIKREHVNTILASLGHSTDDENFTALHTSRWHNKFGKAEAEVPLTDIAEMASDGGKNSRDTFAELTRSPLHEGQQVAFMGGAPGFSPISEKIGTSANQAKRLGMPVQPQKDNLAPGVMGTLHRYDADQFGFAKQRKVHLAEGFLAGKELNYLNTTHGYSGKEGKDGERNYEPLYFFRPAGQRIMHPVRASQLADPALLSAEQRELYGINEQLQQHGGAGSNIPASSAAVFSAVPTENAQLLHAMQQTDTESGAIGVSSEQQTPIAPDDIPELRDQIQQRQLLPVFDQKDMADDPWAFTLPEGLGSAHASWSSMGPGSSDYTIADLPKKEVYGPEPPAGYEKPGQQRVLGSVLEQLKHVQSENTPQQQPPEEAVQQPPQLQTLAINPIPYAALIHGIHSSVGKKFWEREDLASLRNKLTAEHQEKIAERLAAYPKELHQAFKATQQSKEEDDDLSVTITSGADNRLAPPPSLPDINAEFAQAAREQRNYHFASGSSQEHQHQLVQPETHMAPEPLEQQAHIVQANHSNIPGLVSTGHTELDSYLQTVPWATSDMKSVRSHLTTFLQQKTPKITKSEMGEWETSLGNSMPQQFVDSSQHKNKRSLSFVHKLLRDYLGRTGAIYEPLPKNIHAPTGVIAPSIQESIPQVPLNISEDELYNQAAIHAQSQGHISIVGLQKHLKIGENQAKDLMKLLYDRNFETTHETTSSAQDVVPQLPAGITIERGNTPRAPRPDDVKPLTEEMANAHIAQNKVAAQAQQVKEAQQSAGISPLVFLHQQKSMIQQRMDASRKAGDHADVLYGEGQLQHIQHVLEQPELLHHDPSLEQAPQQQTPPAGVTSPPDILPEESANSVPPTRPGPIHDEEDVYSHDPGYVGIEDQLTNLGVGVNAGNKHWEIPTPSKAQKAIIDSHDPHMLVQGGPGSGKTETMIGRLIRMVTAGDKKDRILPSQILSLSALHSGVNAFNEKVQKYNKLLPNDEEHQLRHARSFHSLAYEIMTQGHEYDPDRKERVFPKLEEQGVYFNGKTISDPTKAELALMSPDEREAAMGKSATTFLTNVLHGFTRGNGLVVPNGNQIAAHMKYINKIKGNRIPGIDNPYDESMEKGHEELRSIQEQLDNNVPGKTLPSLTKHAALAAYEQAKEFEGTFDYHDQLHHAGTILRNKGMAAVPADLRDTRAVAIDEGQDNSLVGLNFTGAFMDAIAPNNPHIMVGFDPMQNVIGKELGGLDQNEAENAYTQLMGGNVQKHILHENYRSEAGAVALNNAILGHKALDGQAKSPTQIPTKNTLGNFPKIGLARTQPALYQHMFQSMLAHAGLSWEHIRNNVASGLHPLAQPDGVLSPQQIPAIFTRHQDRNLMMAEIHKSLQEKLGLSSKEAHTVLAQMVRPDVPVLNKKGDNGQEIEDAKQQFPLLTHAGSRSWGFIAPHMDVTQVGGGGMREYLRRLFIGTSRVQTDDTHRGQMNLFATNRPFSDTQYEAYLHNPQSFRDVEPNDLTGANGVFLGKDVVEPDKKKNKFERFQNMWVPQHFAGIFQHQQKLLSDQGIDKKTLDAWTQGQTPSGTTPPPVTPASAEASMAPMGKAEDVPIGQLSFWQNWLKKQTRSRGVIFSTSQEEAMAKQFQQHTLDMAADWKKRFDNDPTSKSSDFLNELKDQHEVLRQSVFPQLPSIHTNYMHTMSPKAYAEKDLPFAAYNEASYQFRKNPDQLDQLAQVNRGFTTNHSGQQQNQAPQSGNTPAAPPAGTVPSSITANGPITIAAGANAKITVTSPNAPPPPPVSSSSPSPLNSSADQRMSAFSANQFASGSGSGGSGGSGGGRRSGGGNNNSSNNDDEKKLFSDPGFGYKNVPIQIGRTLARIGDELQFVSKNAQQTADSALQEGSDYRHATLQIMRDTTATTDPYGHSYAAMDQGNAQTSNGKVTGGFSNITGILLNSNHPLGFKVQLSDTQKQLMYQRAPKDPNYKGPGYTGNSAAGDNGTQGFFDFTNSDNPGTIAYLQKNTLPMYSYTQIAQNMQGYQAAQNETFTKGSINASTDIMALSSLSGIDTNTLTGQIANIVGYTNNGTDDSKDQQTQHLMGIISKMFNSNYSQQNVAPFLQAMESVIPNMEWSSSGGNQTNQAAVLLQLALNNGATATNLPDVANAINGLSQLGENPDQRQQYALAQLYGEKNLTASPQYWQYKMDQSQRQQELGGMQLQENIFGSVNGPDGKSITGTGSSLYDDYLQQLQSVGLGSSALPSKISLQDLQIQADNAQINLDKVNLQQSEFSLSQNQASFNFNQYMQTQQYGAIGQDTSKTAYFNFQRSQLAAGYNPANADAATNYKPAQPFGLQNEQFYAGIENQRSMTILDRSPLLADAKFQQQMKYLNEQENFYVRSIELQNEQRTFDKDWGQQSLDMQATALEAQKQMFVVQVAMQELDKAQQALQAKYLPQMADDLSALIMNMDQSMQGKGPVNGKNVDAASIIQQLADQFKNDNKNVRGSNLRQTIQSMGFTGSEADQLFNMVQAEAQSGKSIADLEKQFGLTDDSQIIKDLKGLNSAGANAAASQSASTANTNTVQGGVGANWDALTTAVQNDADMSKTLADALSGTTGLTKHIGDLSDGMGKVSGWIGALVNILGVIGGFAGGAGGAGGAHVGGAGGSSTGMSMLPHPSTISGIGGKVNSGPVPEGPKGDSRNAAASFWVNFMERITDRKMQKEHQTTYSHYGIMTPHVNADFHARLSYGQHQGVDFAADQGTPLEEFTGGEVTGAGFYPWGGEVDVLIPGGLTERYLHLSQIGVHPGQTIKRGDRIGLTGGGTVASGYGKWSSGAHSHIQFDHGDINNGVNPWPVFAAFQEYNLQPFYGMFADGTSHDKSGAPVIVPPAPPAPTHGKVPSGGAMLPAFARGAIVMKPTVGLIGDGETGEAIIPLNKLQSVLKTVTPATGSSVSSSVSSPHVLIQKLVDQLHIHVTMAGSQISESEKDQLMSDLLDVLSTATKQLAGKLS